MDNFFVSEFQYTEEMYSGISETVVERKPDSILYLNSAGFPVFFLMLIIRRNLVYLFLELLPILLLLLIRVKVSRAIKIEKEDIR